MTIDYVRIDAHQIDALAAFLCGEVWPFHGHPRLDPAWVQERAAQGYFDGDDARSFWLVRAGERCGLVRAFDLGDPTPLFDLRIASRYRGTGLGTHALGWLTGHVFATFPDAHRLGGYTRHDNLGMRRVFDKCGFTREAHHREAWRVEGSPPVDTLGYAILRREWQERRGDDRE